MRAGPTIEATIKATTFYLQVELPHAEHLIHLPILNPKELIFTVLGVPLCSELTFIMFKMSSKETGALIVAYSDVFTEEFFDSCELFEKKIVF